MSETKERISEQEYLMALETIINYKAQIIEEVKLSQPVKDYGNENKLLDSLSWLDASVRLHNTLKSFVRKNPNIFPDYSEAKIAHLSKICRSDFSKHKDVGNKTLEELDGLMKELNLNYA